jgi:hypothetical protein
MPHFLNFLTWLLHAPRRYYEWTKRKPKPGKCGCGADIPVGETRCDQCWADRQI